MRAMFSGLIWFFLIIVPVWTLAQNEAQYARGFLPGANNFFDYYPFLNGKKVGLLTNSTGTVVKEIHTAEGKTIYKQQSLVDFFLENQINLIKIFAPEHGFRGTADAGELIKDGWDTQTNLPVLSLYGNNKKPTPEQLSDIEVMVFDLQDVGARFYTYISSLHYLMEACAENNIPLVVLDRPNPNGGIVDGPVLEVENQSFVGMHPVPVLHGMTIGEYARMINGEKWLKNGISCKLIVIESRAYFRQMPYSLPIAPSPNLPNDKAVNLYASLCFFEGTNVSVGRGTNKQFQIFGSPYLKNMQYSFVPQPNNGAKDPLHKGKKCFGRDLSKYKNLNKLELKWLLEAYENTVNKSKFFNNFFIKLAGTKTLQKQIEAGLSESEIRKSWQKDLEAFKKIRSKYLIYD